MNEALTKQGERLRVVTPTSRRHNLGPISQIPHGQGRVFEVAGRLIAVFRPRGGGIYATQAHCPHRAGTLADGLLGRATLSCPLHEWRFDLSSGRALQGDCGIDVYPAAIGPREQILVDLPEA
jgi:nitrite reductase (NADH) small subunit